MWDVFVISHIYSSSSRYRAFLEKNSISDLNLGQSYSNRIINELRLKFYVHLYLAMVVGVEQDTLLVSVEK